MSRWLVLACAVVLCSGCVYVDVKTPLDTDLNRTQLGAKEGRASSRSILGLVAWGDSSTHAAATQGGLTTINHADMEVFSVLGVLYSRQTLVVYGD